jgi:hypothetical protein
VDRSSLNPSADTIVELERAWEAARALGRERIGDNQLNHNENCRLIETRSEEEAIILVLRGLRRSGDQEKERNQG